MSVSRQEPHKTGHLGLYISLFLFLFAVYLFTYTPRINSSDGLAMFATAESLVRRGALDIEQIRWMDLQQGTYGLDGLLYSRKGIGVPLGLLPLTGLGLVIPWLGTVSVSLLFNAIVTALTAVILMAYLQQLGFHTRTGLMAARTGLMAALTFGLATLAWPYAKSLFSDPLAGLLLLAAAFTLLKFKSTHRVRYSLLAGLFLGWTVATRYAEALFLPVYGLLLLHYLFTIHRLSFTIHNLKKFILPPSAFILRSITAFIAPILLITAALIAFNLSRYGNAFNTGYLPNETFSAIWGEGILGQLISPGRGLLLYSPILILCFFGVIPFFRHHRAEAILALSVIVIHLLLYGKWFMWHGGYAWGPRFLIPTLPFWCLFLAPIIAISDFRFWIFDSRSKRQNRKSKMLGLIFFLLIALSLIPQILAVSIDFTPFQNSLLETGLPLFDRQTFFSPQYAALIGAWRFISLDTLDLIWAWQGHINVWLLLILVANIIICSVYLIKSSKVAAANQTTETHSPFTPSTSSGQAIHHLPFTITTLSTLIAVVALLAYAHTLPSEPAITALNRAIRPTDAVITNDPNFAMPFAELYKARAPVLGLNNGGFPLPDNVTHRLNETITHHAQIWWLPNWLPPEESAIEQMLLAQGFKVRDEDFEGQRLVLFATPPEMIVYPQKARFDNRINLIAVAYPPNLVTGAALPIELHWQTVTTLSEDYHVFIHLVDETGQILAQADGQPAQWQRPTSSWQVEETIIDRHGLWIPAGIAPGDYQLGIGLYQPESGQRLHLAEGQDLVQFKITIN